MFVKVGDRVSVADLLRGIIVQSGNDACIVVAEALGGSEEAFAEMMTTRVGKWFYRTRLPTRPAGPIPTIACPPETSRSCRNA